MKFNNIIKIAFMLFLCNNINAQETPKSTNQILTTAFEQAKNENKHVFILFKASWCGWCKKMEASMNNDSIKKYFTDNYVIKTLDVLESDKNKNLENPGAEELLDKYGGKNQGIPYYLIFDANKNLIADSKMVKGEEVLKDEGSNIGCPGTEDEIEAFIYKLQQTSNLTSEELISIGKQFKLNNPN